MIVELNKKTYEVCDDEFTTIKHNEYNNLIIKDKLGYFERIISLLCELSKLDNFELVSYNQTHGGFITINSCQHFSNCYILKTEGIHQYNILKNISQYNISNIYLHLQVNKEFNNLIIYSENINDIGLEVVNNTEPIILTSSNPTSLFNKYEHCYKLSNSNLYLYIPNKYYNHFIKEFHYYIDETSNTINYDNLINLCIMVKNGGELFEEMLLNNINIIDRWTILDTGSTDQTIDIINRVLVGKKKGQLYQEPFINFRDSRNRCLDLAEKTCKYNMMLDDTYNIKGDIRGFLNEIRGDQFGDSYSLMIKSHDVEYISNRITKSNNNLRYIFTMHEVIQDKDNINIRVPENRVYVDDRSNEYMQNRSDKRKEYDLKCLFEMVEEYPDEPRHLYYLAQTYKMLENFEKAAEYYYKRAFFRIDGFEQEKFDALFEFTRISIYQLNKPWKDFEQYYKLCTEWQPTRPEGYYFLGIHYFLDNDKKTSFDYFKKAYQIGFPSHQQYSLKPTISYLFTPYYLSSLCYEFKDYKLGYEACTLYLQKNKQDEMYYQMMIDWYKIYSLLVAMPSISENPKIFDKPIFCIVADGGFSNWSGSNILTTGVGGSETWVIEMATHIKKHSDFEVIVFCRCDKEEIFKDVKYIHLDRYLDTISTIKIEHCIISRFSEYIPPTIDGHVENIHVILHDLQLSGNIIPIHPKIKNIFCLTEWHCKLFMETFPQFKEITKPLHYGIDFTNFLSNKTNKVPYSFIYSSFPNRGLIVLLKMWPRIVLRYPQAVLNIFTDVHNKWANDFYKEELEEIRNILDDYKNTYKTSVINHGWVSKKVLSDYWKQSAIWFYPCKFKETFCLTALEAAITNTLAITNGLAALEDTVGSRGITIPGDVLTKEWQDNAFLQICNVLDNHRYINHLIEQNYQWALNHSWEKQAVKLLSIINKPVTTHYNKTENINITITERPPKPLDPIDKIYYINLSSRTDRNKHFLEQCNKQSIPLEKICRFEAVNGLTYTFSPEETNLFKNVNYSYMPTKLKIMGNQLSHLKIFIEMIKQNYQYIIVCQDDVILKNGFIEYINLLVSNLPQNAEIIHFGFHKYAVRDIFLPWDLNSNNDDILCFSKVNDYICKLKPDFNAFYNTNNSTAYILTLQGAKNYVQHVLQNGFKYATDCDINKYLIDKDIYFGSNIVLATTLIEFGSDVFENIYNSETLTQPHKLTKNNNYLNYSDMYNWTNDLPENTNAKLTFVKILSNFVSYPSCNILEIGTFVGTSIIAMLQYLPNANATTIDPWINYLEEEYGTNKSTDYLKNIEENNIEQIFHENISKAGFTNKVTPIKGDSAFILPKLIKYNHTYDFIYIDASHKAIDCYTDCLLSWQLLNKNGIIAIDDYLYKISLVDEFENVQKGVDHFLHKIQGQYIILEKGFRLFIQKI
jgi:predicted O-methyltransferase YrrM/GR25 family glycosyltransferase involved in LPS biosynthesis